MSTIERRNSSRFNIPPDRESAELRWEQCDYAGRLTDQSAGGFGIQFDTPIGIQAGQDAVLSWVGGCCRVRVSARVDEENFIRLGLLRLEELETAADLDPAPSVWALYRRQVPLPQGNWSYCLIGLLIVLGCAITALVWEHVPSQLAREVQATGRRTAEAADAGSLKTVQRRLQEASGFIAAQVGDGTALPMMTSRALPKPIRDWIATRNQVVRQAAASILQVLPEMPLLPSTQTVSEAITATTRAAEQMIGINNDSVLPAISQYMELLQVSAEQRVQLEALLKSTREATQAVQRRGRELGTVATMNEIDRIRRAAGTDATVILSDEQLGQLRRLISTKRPSGSGAGAATSKAGPLVSND